MGKDSPPPPDYTGAAEATGQSQIDAINAQTRANRPNVSTPWGTQTWTERGRQDFDDTRYRAANPDLTPQLLAQHGLGSLRDHWDKYGKKEGRLGGEVQGTWESDISLDPRLQAALDSQMRLQAGRSGAAEDLLGSVRSNFATPFDWGSLPSRSGAIDPATGRVQTAIGNPTRDFGSLDGDSSDYRDRAQSAVEQLQAPQLARRRAAVETQLANQGIPPGSEAWNEAMEQVNDAETRAGLQAISEGRNESTLMFGQDLSAAGLDNQVRGQEFGENLSRGQFNNLSQQQQLQQLLQAGNFNNTNRGQALTEAQMRRNMPLNELNALLSGQQVDMPGMPSAPTAGAGGATDYLSAVSNQYNAALGASNAQNAQTAGNVSTAATLGMLAYMAF